MRQETENKQVGSSIRRLWSEQELEILRTMFPDNYTEVICNAINRGYRSVASKAYLMGLKKSEEFMKMELKRQADRLTIAGSKNRFKKGRISENKGKPMSKGLYEKIKHFMFKKGNKPHNTKYDGHERINTDGYTKIRIKEGKYVIKHRHIWEQVNGKIPKGYILIFKDKNPQNIVLENLELINRQENMERNTIHRFTPELKNTIRLVTKLKQAIHAKE